MLNNVDNAPPVKIEVLPSSWPCSWQGITQLARRLITHIDSSCNSTVGNSFKSDNSDVPHFIVELNTIVTQFRTWQALLPRVEPHYAVKCQPDPVVIQMLAALGCNFDCASVAELQLVTNLGVSADRVILAQPCKVRNCLRLAADIQVGLTVTDSVEDLRKTARFWPNARVLMRILPPEFPALCPLGLKFGVAKDDWSVVGQEAHRLGVNIVGVAFHVGSACLATDAWAEAVALAAEAFELLASDEGGAHKDLSVLDVGGGFPGEIGLGGKSNVHLDVSHKIDTKVPLFQAICCPLRAALDQYFPPERGVRIIAEPGRFFAHSAFHLITKVVNRRTRLDAETNTRGYTYYLNDGPYGTFTNLIFDHALAPRPTVLSLQNPVVAKRREFVCKVYGPTCDEDPIAERCFLPELLVEDFLLWPNMGAYTSASASNFNGMPQAQRCYFVNEHVLPLLRTALMPYLAADCYGLANRHQLNATNLHRLKLRSGSGSETSEAVPLSTGSALPLSSD